MNHEEMVEHAKRIVYESIRYIEFAYVYEDEELLEATEDMDEDAQEQLWRDIHNIILTKLTVAEADE